MAYDKSAIKIKQNKMDQNDMQKPQHIYTSPIARNALVSGQYIKELPGQQHSSPETNFGRIRSCPIYF